VANGGTRRTLRSAAAMACVLAAGLCGAPAGAQDVSADADASADAEAETLEEIEVVGRMLAAGWQGASDAVYATPGAVAEIGREAIDARGGARNAADLLRGVAGVDGVFDRQNPGLNVNIRGLQDQGRVNMSVDGARQNFQQAGHGASAFAFVDPELIGGVEIDKGPTSLAGGAGVIGGVVNFRTLDFDDVALPGKDHGVRVNATTGTNAFDFNGSLAAAAKVSDAFEVVGAVGRKRLGEYEAGKRGDLDYGGAGEAARFTTQDQWSWLAKATADIAENHRVTLSYTGLAADFGTGSGTFVDDNKVENHTAVADWRWTPGDAWADLAAKLYYARTGADQFRPDRNPDSTAGTDAFRVDYAIDTVGGSLANTSRFRVAPFDVALTYGAEAFFDRTATASVGEDPADDPTGSQFSGSTPSGERGVGGVFSRAELSHGDWLKILLGGRYDRFGMTGSGVAFDQPGPCASPVAGRCPRDFDVDVSGGRFSPTATVAVTPLKGLQVYASYEQGYRPPNIMEAILGGAHIGGFLPSLPNPDLKPEVSRTVEAGVNLMSDGVLTEGDAFRAKASLYRTGVDDFIAFAQYEVDFNRAVNLKDRTVLKGVEIEANYDAGFAYLGGTAAILDARYGEDYDAGEDDRFKSLSGVFLAPKRKFSLDGGARFLERRLTVGGRVTHYTPEDQFGVAPGFGYAYRRYTLIDAYASYKINENVTVRAAIENIRDVAYVDALGAPLSPAPGRTVTVGATARF
jgi:TonB-dependent heme/hemoglobin receptor